MLGIWLLCFCYLCISGYIFFSLSLLLWWGCCLFSASKGKAWFRIWKCSCFLQSSHNWYSPVCFHTVSSIAVRGCPPCADAVDASLPLPRVFIMLSRSGQITYKLEARERLRNQSWCKNVWSLWGLKFWNAWKFGQIGAIENSIAYLEEKKKKENLYGICCLCWKQLFFAHKRLSDLI